MKKIINGKKYDTETAKEVGYWENGGMWRDFSHMEETLYLKKTGEFFLFGEGGPMTKYSVSQGQNSWSGGSRIIPLSYENARQWAEEHLDADEYESVFGEVEEDETKVSATFRLSASVLEAMRRKASESGSGLSDYLESILTDALR